jgi:hypothetical protein
MDRLINIGFKKAGEWILENDSSISFVLNDFSSNKNILYAFILENEIMYIGKSTRTLRERMINYKNADKSQSTNIKIKNKILELLKKNNNVEIYAFSDNGLLKYGVFTINLAAGLEDNMIDIIKPQWNDQI